MKKKRIKIRPEALVVILILLCACASSGNKSNKGDMNKENEFEEGSYGYDVAFLKDNEVDIIELTNDTGEARILLAPGYQGRVMTSAASGKEGTSFGWINHDLITSEEVSKQFNPVGGEERFWLGPEGGPFSIYFEEGKDQEYENWVVPAVIDTEPFGIKSQDENSVVFTKETTLNNASGTEFKVGIERTVQMMDLAGLNEFFNIRFQDDVLDIVAYKSENQITNQGENAWTKEDGLLSIWMLSMFSPSPSTTVFLPFREDGDGPVVNDDYFGKVPSDRLIIEDGVVYFKIDGAYRSKIGIPPGRAKELCGSYDSAGKVLTLVWGSLPDGDHDYVNSKWGPQDDPFDGDAINAYNDGPVDDGSIMGPFYEIETSSPGAVLNQGESLTHTQVIVHVQGSEEELAKLVDELFKLDLNNIATKFQ